MILPFRRVGSHLCTTYIVLAPHCLATSAMKKKVRSARVPELSNVDTENEKTLPPVHWVITAVANEPSSETGVTTARQLPGNGGEVVRVTTYRPIAGFETEKPICPQDDPS